MGNLKNFFFMAVFMLLGFSVQAEVNPRTTISTYDLTLNNPQIDGIVNVTQGRHALTVNILVTGPVNLIVRNESGEVVSQRFARQQVRRVKINIKNYESGSYVLSAESRLGVQMVDFDITE